MKKLVFLSLLLTLLASAVFAQVADGISIGAWGRGAFAPFIGVGEYKKQGSSGAADETIKAENYMGTGNTWSNLPSYQFSITGNSDYVGFGLGLISDASGNPIGGDGPWAHVWVKPFSNDWLKITVGNFNDDTLRGKIGGVNGGFDAFVLRDKGAYKDADVKGWKSNFLYWGNPLASKLAHVGKSAGGRRRRRDFYPFWNRYRLPIDQRPYRWPVYRRKIWYKCGFVGRIYRTPPCWFW